MIGQISNRRIMEIKEKGKAKEKEKEKEKDRKDRNQILHATDVGTQDMLKRIALPKDPRMGKN